MALTFRPATPTDIPLLQELARTTWLATYPGIISQEQIDYMLGRMYSADTIAHEIEAGAPTWVVAEEVGESGEDGTANDGQAVGYASFGPHPTEPWVARLHKLYLLPNGQGRGWGKALLQHVIEQTQAQGYTALELNVNKRNPATQFYLRQGFSQYREEVLDIGQGFVMDDYVMRRML